VTVPFHAAGGRAGKEQWMNRGTGSRAHRAVGSLLVLTALAAALSLADKDPWPDPPTAIDISNPGDDNPPRVAAGPGKAVAAVVDLSDKGPWLDRGLDLADVVVIPNPGGGDPRRGAVSNPAPADR
jgi:hypothetical protein